MSVRRFNGGTSSKHIDSDDLAVEHHHKRPSKGVHAFLIRRSRRWGGDKRTFSRPGRQMGIDLNRMHTFANRFDIIPSYRENCKQLPMVAISLSLCGLDPMRPKVGIYGELL